MIHTIESDTPFDVILPDFWELEDIPDRYESCKNMKRLNCIKGFGLVSSNGLKEIK